MVRRERFWIVPVVGTVLLCAGWVSRAQEPPRTTTEKIKEKVGSAVESLKKGATSAEEAIKEQYARARASIARMGVQARVHARLHWDKALAGSRVELAAPRTGVIELRGTVADAKAKARAVELAADTVGVTEVIDHTTVQATPAATGTTPNP